MKSIYKHPTFGQRLFLFVICTILTCSVTGMPKANATGNSYTLSGNQQEDVVTVAEAQIGLKAADFGFTTEWCAYFVNWVGNKAAPGLFPSSATSLGTGKDIVVWMANRDYAKFYYFEDQAKTSLDNKNAGTPDYSTGNYIKTDADSFTPQRGDIILFHWAGNSAYWDHVALVSGVSGDTVSYIGGNQGSGGSYATRAVTRTSISKTGGEVIGFLRPNYGGKDAPLQTLTITQGSTILQRPATTYNQVTQIVSSYLSIIGSDAHWNAYHSYGGDDTSRLCREVDSGDFTSCLTRTACPSLTGSTCYSNAFSGPIMSSGRQCAGFADYMWYIVFNSTAAQPLVYSVSSNYLFMPGDIIRYNISGGQHSVFVYSSDGSNATLIECNYGGHCAIKTRTVSQSTLRNWVNQSGAFMVKSIAVNDSGCSHNYITENEYGHPHYEYRKCTKCGAWEYTGNTGYRSDCSECNVHVHSYVIEYEYAHPHKEYRKCTSCGYVEYTGNTTWCNWCYKCCPPTPTIPDYPVPFKAYPLSTEHYAASAYPSLNDVINGTSFLGYIYGEDLCTIKEVYAGGYCLVNCPWGSGTKDVYTYLGSFLNASYTPRTVTAATTITTYTHASGSTTLGWIDPGDTLVVVDEYGGRTQVIYPHSSDGTYRCGWVDSIPQPDPGTYAVGSPSLCAEHWTVTATSGLRCRTNAGTSYTLNNEYGLAYGVELIIAQKQYDSAGSLWGWGHGYSNTLGTNIGGWFCLDYANYDYSYLPGAPSITAIVAGSTTTPTLIKWNSTDRATSYDIYVDGTMQAWGIQGTQYSLNLGAGTHSVYVVAVNKDYAYAYDPYVYYTSGPASSVNIAAAPTPYAVRAAQWNGHTYVLYEGNLTWQDAKSFCERNGGTLACVTSAQEEAIVESVAGAHSHVWLGGYEENGSYRWVTGEGFSFSDWSSGEPNNESGLEHYLEVNAGLWNDLRMNSEYVQGLVMEFSTPSIEYVTSTDWQGHTYTVYHGCVTWEDAKTFCEENGGYLAVITSSAEQALIESLNSSSQNLWLGAEDKDGDGTYRWVTGEAMSYTKWGNAQPDCDRGVEHYLGTYSQNWNDFPNYYPTIYGFVMEKVIPITTYTVTYDAMNGSGAPAAQTVDLGMPCTLSSDIPTRSGYIFKGWDISANAVNARYQPNGSLIADSDVTLYAVWEKEIALQYIVFDTSELQMDKGDSSTLNVTFAPSDATNRELIWSSDAPDIVSVKDGVLTANKAGLATITCTPQDERAVSVHCRILVWDDNSTLTLPVSMRSIEEEAFTGDTEAQVVRFDSPNAQKIGAKAFFGCENLRIIVLGENVSSIATDAFDGCDDLTIVCTEDSYVEWWAERHNISVYICD